MQLLSNHSNTCKGFLAYNMRYFKKHFMDLNGSHGIGDGSEDAQDERALRAEDALL